MRKNGRVWERKVIELLFVVIVDGQASSEEGRLNKEKNTDHRKKSATIVAGENQSKPS